MEETTVTVFAMLIAAIIMFIVPLILVSDTSDDIAELVVQTATADFVSDVIKTGEITSQKYYDFIARLNSSGNTYDIEMEVKILDENTAKLKSSKKVTAFGGIYEYEEEIPQGVNRYYSIYTSQIEEKILQSRTDIDDNNAGKLILKQGDGISVKVKNSSATFSQALKSAYYSAIGEDLHIISATASGTIAIDGRT